MTSWDINTTCNYSLVFTFDVMQNGCDGPSKSLHILPTHGLSSRWEVTFLLHKFQEEDTETSQASWLSEKDFFGFGVPFINYSLSSSYWALLMNSLFPFSSTQSIRSKVGNPKWRKNECVIFKLPANSEHLVLQGGGRPCQWEPLSSLSTPREQPTTRWTRRHVCAGCGCMDWHCTDIDSLILHICVSIEGTTVVWMNIFHSNYNRPNFVHFLNRCWYSSVNIYLELQQLDN